MLNHDQLGRPSPHREPLLAVSYALADLETIGSHSLGPALQGNHSTMSADERLGEVSDPASGLGWPRDHEQTTITLLYVKSLVS